MTKPAIKKHKTPPKPKVLPGEDSVHEPVRLFEMGGGWGNSIGWNGPEQFQKKELTEKSLFSCHGWKREKPKVGDHLKAEFERSWMTFEFVEVKPCGDPPDMFFAEVRPIKQEMK